MSSFGAISGMIAGGITVIVWKQLSGGIFDLYELIPGFFISSLVALLCGRIRS
jgi:sodium/proline symporter